MSFEAFWAAYPRHEAKKDARKAWERLSPTSELVTKILTALEWQVLQEQWTKDDGQYVPLPATWLRGERWEDERRNGAERRLSNVQAMSDYQRWLNEGGCRHTPRCPHFTACQVVSGRSKAS